MYRDLDYFRTKDNILFIVKGDYHPKGRVLAYPVFWPDSSGDRHHPTLRRNYQKDTSDVLNDRIFSYKNYQPSEFFPSCPLVPVSDIVVTYHPLMARRRFLEMKQGSVWHNILFALHEIGDVPLSDIGIFGSFLVGFYNNLSDIRKDIDYVVYGFENCEKLRKSMPKILDRLSLSGISQDHISYESKKLGGKFSASNNTFNKTLARKWSSIQVAPGVLTTIRFAYKNDEIPENPISCDEQKYVVISGKVIECSGANFVPRVFWVSSNKRKYKIVTYFWVYQSPVRDGDYVKISGVIHSDGRTVSLNKLSHGIKIIN